MREKSYFILSLLLLTFQHSYAQTDTELTSMSLKDLLDVKVTTASKTLQEVGVAPATVTVITKEQINARGYQSLLDVLTDLPDIKVDDKVYSGQRNIITIRGVEGQQNFFILLDGVKISSPTNEALPIMENYPIYLAEQIEIVYGPASALYGADAVTGVINIITKKTTAKDFVVNAKTTAGLYGYTNSSLFLSKKIAQNASLVLAGEYCYDKQPDLSKIYKDDSLVSVAHYGQGTFNTIYGPMTPTEPVSPKYEAPTAAHNIYGALQVGNFSFSLFSSYTKLPNAYGNNTWNAVYNKDVYMAQSVSALSTAYKRSFERLQLTSNLTASRYDLRPGSNYRNLYTGMERAYKYSTCLSVKAEQQVDYSFSHYINLTAGGSYERITTVPQSADLDQPVDTKLDPQGAIAGTRSYYKPEGLPAKFYNIMYDNIGAYLQAQLSPTRVLNFTLGARYDYNTRYGKTFNPRLGMVLKPNYTTTVKAMYGSAFMAPPPSTAYVTYGSFETADSGKTYTSPFLHLANPNLGPVKSQNVELSLNQYLGQNIMLNVDGYYTHLNGLFNFADDNATTKRYHNSFNGIPVDYIEVFVNDGEQESYGGSIQLNLKHSVSDIFFNSYASLSYMNGRRSGGNLSTDTVQYRAEIPFISPFTIRIGTDMRKGKFSCSPRLLIMGKQRLPGVKDTTGTLIRMQQIPGYVLLNISARYEFNKKIAVFATITNALDRRYRVPAFNMDLDKKPTEVFYGQPADPLRVYAGVNLSLQ